MLTLATAVVAATLSVQGCAPHAPALNRAPIVAPVPVAKPAAPGADIIQWIIGTPEADL